MSGLLQGVRRFALWPIKLALVAGGWLHSRAGRAAADGRYAFLIYHAVSGRWPLELDLPPGLFSRQVRYLAQTGRVVAYDAAVAALQEGRARGQGGFVLTFDDGYRDFYTHVFPLLQELGIPAMLFVTTGFVEEEIPYPVLGRRLPDVRSVTWEMLGEMAASGLVSVGAHTHTHPDLGGLALDQAAEELERSQELFRRRLGFEPVHFAYPKAHWQPGVEPLVAARYRSAVVGGGTWAAPGAFHPYRIPRVPIRRSDGWLFFQAKIRGWLQGEEAVYERLRGLRRGMSFS